ncbi:MAG: HNH endonuclease [Bacteroidales bacterium]|nr:HNH endonuclease [Bacteroidales bacterium]
MKSSTVTFKTIPHILPKSLGGKETCVDVCDECNHYFGTPEKGLPSIDLVVREILESYRLFGTNYYEKHELSKKFVFFHYNKKKKRLKLKNPFREAVITTQFKRGLYELFLQKYHIITKDGNNPRWDFVRTYARYSTAIILREPHIFYAYNNVTLFPDDEHINIVPMSDKLIGDALKYGVFHLLIMGQSFYLEVLPHLFQQYGKEYLQNEANTMLLPIKGNECIYEFTSIRQIDPFMTRYNT